MFRDIVFSLSLNSKSQYNESNRKQHRKAKRKIDHGKIDELRKRQIN